MADSGKEAQYSLLKHRDSDDEELSVQENEAIPHYLDNSWARRLPSFWSLCVIGLFLVSASLNVILASKCRRHEVLSENKSKYLGLEFDYPTKLWWNTEFSGEDESVVDHLWNKTMPWESGIIALKNEEATAMGLPKSQPWPWDAQHKSIYIVNAHHILHCVRNLYISIHEYRHNKPQSVDYPHILHCLDSIRSDTMCLADDTPRYVPLNSVHGFRPGDGQQRQCRDWNKVTEFVNKHDPCYRYIAPGDKSVSNLERFKYCPKDSQYLPIIRQYFGFADDWVPNYNDE